MNIDVELLRKICNRYGATLEENKSGGFTFDDVNYKEGEKNKIPNNDIKKFIDINIQLY